MNKDTGWAVCAGSSRPPLPAGWGKADDQVDDRLLLNRAWALLANVDGGRWASCQTYQWGDDLLAWRAEFMRWLDPGGEGQHDTDGLLIQAGDLLERVDGGEVPGEQTGEWAEGKREWLTACGARTAVGGQGGAVDGR